jgi:hypothetical protein
VCANNISACTQQTHTYAHRQGQQVHEAQCRDKPINDTNIKLLSVVRGAPAGAHRARSSSCAELIVRGAPAGTTHPSLFASLSLSLSLHHSVFFSHSSYFETLPRTLHRSLCACKCFHSHLTKSEAHRDSHIETPLTHRPASTHPPLPSPSTHRGVVGSRTRHSTRRT